MFSRDIKTMTSEPRSEDGFVPTLNKTGHMLEEPDEYGQAFINYITHIKGKGLDIGAAYGVTTLPALKGGASILAIDLSKEHLNILDQKTPNAWKDRLALQASRFPDGLCLPSEIFDAVIASRVLHFLKGEEIILGFKKIYDFLKPGGHFFFVGLTPFIGNYESFIPLYIKRKAEGNPWPGHVSTDPYLNHRKHQMPNFLTMFDIEKTQELLKETGFIIKKIGYTSPKRAPSELRLKDPLLQGKEHVGAIAMKPLKE
jgi:SAM-dependent methyltransferase